MRVSEPIEKLVHDLEQERAKDYWEQVKRFRSQETERKKAGEAHEKKQLEYMRSVGIKPDTIEKEQEEDSRNLKSYLEQTRPPMISRPLRSEEDTKHAALLATKLGDLGLIVPVNSSFQLPPDPGPVLPSDLENKNKGRKSGVGHRLGCDGACSRTSCRRSVCFHSSPERPLFVHSCLRFSRILHFKG